MESAARVVLRRLDHAAIFVLIAGTFTPIHLILFRGLWRWGPLLAIWSLTIAGITLKTIFFSQIPEAFGISMFLGMGWIGMFSGGVIWMKRGFEMVEPLFHGALLYSLGTIFEFLEQPTVIQGVVGHHELFHIAVLCGVALHWKFVRTLVSHGVTIGKKDRLRC